MKWIKDKVSLKIASVMALLPVVSWSSSCITEDAYGCPNATLKHDKQCCEQRYENQNYAQMCYDILKHSDVRLLHNSCGSYCDMKQMDCVINKCGDLNKDNSNSNEWWNCVDTSLNDEAQCK